MPCPLVIVYGDSVAEGYNATDRPNLGWAGLLRPMGYATVLDTASGRRLVTDLTSTAAVQARVRKWLRWQPTDIWLAIGSNDSFGGESLETFSTRYAQLLDELEARAPQVNVYAQSPIRRAGETTLQSFRDAIAAICNSRLRVTYVDGYPIINPNTDVDDGTHPTNAGHQIYASNVASILGWDR